MNSSNTTSGGYKGSYMNVTVLPIYAEALNTSLNGHLLDYLTAMSSYVSGGKSTNWEWVKTKMALLTESQVFGSDIVCSSYCDIGTERSQLSLFRLNTKAQMCISGGTGDFGSIGMRAYWFREVIDSSSFAAAPKGLVRDYVASMEQGVRPFFIIG